MRGDFGKGRIKLMMCEIVFILFYFILMYMYEIYDLR